MNVAFTNLNMLGQDACFGSEGLTLSASTTHYTAAFPITFWDSKDGIFFTAVGTRYATLDSDVQIQVQQATLANATTSAWENIGTPQNFGTGGTVGSPSSTYLTIKLWPSPNQSLMPFLRLKITTAAGAGCTFTTLYRTTRGR